MKQPIIVTVSGGVAEVVQETVPKSVAVEVVDLDTLKAMGGNVEAFISDGHASQTAVYYLQEKGLL